MPETEQLQVHRWRGAARARAGLLAAFALHTRLHRGSSMAIGGTWAGPKTLFAQPETAGLVRWLTGLLPEGDWRLDGWGVLHVEGDTLAPHDHLRSQHGGQNAWAGVYWLAGGHGDDLFVTQGAGEVTPVIGGAVLFPADLVHCTAPAKAERKSIAFNVAAA